MAPRDDQDLVEQALAGNDEALRSLIDTLTPVIHARVVRALSRRRDLAQSRDIRQEVEDMAQEVFGGLFAKNARVLRSWDATKGLSLKNFVGLVAEREVASILRTGTRNPWRDDPTLEGELSDQAGPESGPERQVSSRELLRVILDHLRMQLSPRGMHMFQLLIVEGRSTEEVCGLTGMTPDAVYAWRSRCAKLVKRIATEVMSEPPNSSRIPRQESPPRGTVTG